MISVFKKNQLELFLIKNIYPRPSCDEIDEDFFCYSGFSILNYSHKKNFIENTANFFVLYFFTALCFVIFLGKIKNIKKSDKMRVSVSLLGSSLY